MWHSMTTVLDYQREALCPYATSTDYVTISTGDTFASRIPRTLSAADGSPFASILSIVGEYEFLWYVICCII